MLGTILRDIVACLKHVRHSLNPLFCTTEYGLPSAAKHPSSFCNSFSPVGLGSKGLLKYCKLLCSSTWTASAGHNYCLTDPPRAPYTYFFSFFESSDHVRAEPWSGIGSDYGSFVIRCTTSIHQVLQLILLLFYKVSSKLVSMEGHS